jgi:hypothetical protein
MVTIYRQGNMVVIVDMCRSWVGLKEIELDCVKKWDISGFFFFFFCVGGWGCMNRDIGIFVSFPLHMYWPVG